MRRTRFSNGTIVGGHDGLVIEAGVIAHDPSAPVDRVVDLEGGFLLPGFIDTQVNGGGGVLFNDSPTVESIARIGEAHRPYGTTAFLPTLISDDLATVDAAMRAVEQAIAQGVPGVVGIHIEGPFLNAARKGTHDETKFLRLDDRAIALLSGLKIGRTLVTLAPEQCAPGDIEQLVAAGVVVAAGHTDASYATMKAAFAAGVTGVTHLFNAMSPLNHREPGVVGATLENQSAYAGVIVDGRHVDPVALRIAMAARPKDRFMLVTDAMPTVGSAAKSFVLQGKTIHVENGVCVEENGTLAGSDLDMATAVRNAVHMVGLSIAQAATMAATAPAAFMGLKDRGSLAPGLRADLVWLDAELRPRGVWVVGERQGTVVAG
ncbi:N-acetylglucosamine-6-phosphate deacetylase [soil metagenome]